MDGTGVPAPARDDAGVALMGGAHPPWGESGRGREWERERVGRNVEKGGMGGGVCVVFCVSVVACPGCYYISVGKSTISECFKR